MFLWVSSLCPKVGEGGLGEKVRSGHLFWTMAPLPPSRASWGWSGDSCKVGAVGVQGCAGMWTIKQGCPLACMVVIIPLGGQCSHVMLLPVPYVQGLTASVTEQERWKNPQSSHLIKESGP